MVLTRIWSIWLKSGEVIFKHKSAVIVWIDLEKNRAMFQKWERKNTKLINVPEFRRNHDQTSCHWLFNVDLHINGWTACIYLFLPSHSHVCSRDRVGCRGHIWVCVPQAVFLPDLPRVSSCGGLTPGPRCPAEGCNAGAGALKGLGDKRQGNVIHTQELSMWGNC